MAWNRLTTNFKLGMLFKKMYCKECGTKLKISIESEVLSKEDFIDEENKKYSGLGPVKVITSTYYCPECDRSTTYEEQKEIEKVQKRINKKILEKSDFIDKRERTIRLEEKKKKLLPHLLFAIVVNLIFLYSMYYYFSNNIKNLLLWTFFIVILLKFNSSITNTTVEIFFEYLQIKIEQVTLTKKTKICNNVKSILFLFILLVGVIALVCIKNFITSTQKFALTLLFIYLAHLWDICKIHIIKITDYVNLQTLKSESIIKIGLLKRKIVSSVIYTAITLCTIVYITYVFIISILDSVYTGFLLLIFIFYLAKSPLTHNILQIIDAYQQLKALNRREK